MSEPDYLRQTGEWAGMSDDERDAWWRSTFEEARAEGCTFMRRSLDSFENPTMALCEAWIAQPADQGPIRWQLEEAKP